MKAKMRYLTTLLVATAASAAAIGLAPVAIADPGAASDPQPTGQAGPVTPPNPGPWAGGQAAGGTGADTGPDTGTGPAYWHGGEPAGGTGADTGPDTATGPNAWSGGESAGAIG
jgi:hypothetical protein